MNSIKALYLRWKVNKDEMFLLRQGMRKAKQQGLELELGDNYTASLDEGDRKDRLYLPAKENGVDVRKLIALVADDYPKVARRYLDNKEKLGW